MKFFCTQHESFQMFPSLYFQQIWSDAQNVHFHCCKICNLNMTLEIPAGSKCSVAEWLSFTTEAKSEVSVNDSYEAHLSIRIIPRQLESSVQL